MQLRRQVQPAVSGRKCFVIATVFIVAVILAQIIEYRRVNASVPTFRRDVAALKIQNVGLRNF